MNFPEIVDIAQPAEGVFHNLVFVSIRKTYPMQACKIMHGLWGMVQMMFTKYTIVVDDDWTCITAAKSSPASAPIPIRNATAWWPSARTGEHGGTQDLPLGSWWVSSVALRLRQTAIDSIPANRRRLPKRAADRNGGSGWHFCFSPPLASGQTAFTVPTRGRGRRAGPGAVARGR